MPRQTKELNFVVFFSFFIILLVCFQHFFGQFTENTITLCAVQNGCQHSYKAHK